MGEKRIEVIGHNGESVGHEIYDGDILVEFVPIIGGCYGGSQ